MDEDTVRKKKWENRKENTDKDRIQPDRVRELGELGIDRQKVTESDQTDRQTYAWINPLSEKTQHITLHA